MKNSIPKSVDTRALFNPKLIQPALKNAFLKLNPRLMLDNPVMFVVEVGSVITTIFFCLDLAHAQKAEALLSGQISLWLWFTVLFANFAEAMAEGRGKAQAENLKKARTETRASVRQPGGQITLMSSSQLKKGDVVIIEASQVIPADGTVIEGAASVDESAVTGESAPVIREAGGDRSAVTGGTTVLSDQIVIQVSTNVGESFLDRMISLVEGAVRHKTPNEIALNILLSGLTIVFLLVTITLRPYAMYAQAPVPTVVLVALLVCLIPTTIGGLLSSIGIAGMDRLVQRNVLALSGRAVEAAGDIDVLLLDKTGTITMGNRMASELFPAEGITLTEMSKTSLIASAGDQTPEGRSIATLINKQNKQQGSQVTLPSDAKVFPFSAETRMSGVDYAGTQIRKGSLDAVQKWIGLTGPVPDSILASVEKISRQGGTPLVVAKKESGGSGNINDPISFNRHYIGVIFFKRYCETRHQRSL